MKNICNDCKHFINNDCNKDLMFPFNGALSLEVTFIMQIPKSLSKKKQSELIGQYHIKKPDVDNLLKTVKDSLEGTFYKNDSQVCEIVAKKVYGTTSRTIFELNNIV